MRSRLRPGANELAELVLRSRRRPAARTGRPAPADEASSAMCSNERRHVLAAVARRVLDLLADLAERPALPGHRDGRQVPHRMTGHACRIEIRGTMTGVACHARRAVAVGAAHYQGSCGCIASVCGGRSLAGWQFTQRGWVSTLPASSNRAIDRARCIGDAGKSRCRAQFFGAARRRRCVCDCTG